MNEYEWEVQADYGYGDGFECVATATTRAEAVGYLRDYKTNEPSTPLRLRWLRTKATDTKEEIK